jgi:hypothetical protein
MVFSLPNALLWLAATAVPFAAAADTRKIESRSLNPCMANSSFSATLFNVAFSAHNRSIDFDIKGISNIAGMIEADFELLVYGYQAINQKLDPCNLDLEGLCPMNAGAWNLTSNFKVDQDVMSKVPGKKHRVRASAPQLTPLQILLTRFLISTPPSVSESETHRRISCSLVSKPISQTATLSSKRLSLGSPPSSLESVSLPRPSPPAWATPTLLPTLPPTPCRSSATCRPRLSLA